MSKRLSILLLITTLLLSCSPKALREAEEVVAQADSLWHEGKMYGIDEGDSATLAQAYETLNSFVHRTSSLGTFSHACYHYGKLLREKDNPVEAMQCFINATHSRTRDYHILGRVYSNMGDIAHLAGEFPLAYDMYERSGQMYLRNGDSLLYYYDLNNMAFELAESKEINSALYLLDSIQQNCKYLAVVEKTNETRIILFKHTHQYDSILYYFDSVPSYINNEPLVLISKAQAFCYLQQYDSATCYATRTLQASNDLFDRNNAFYILIHCDSIHNGNRVYSLNADRSDVQKLLEIRQGKLSQAVQLLEQDLHRKPDLAWLYAIIVTLLLVGSVIGLYIYKKRQKHQLLSQHISALENKTETTIVQMRQQVEERCLVLMRSSSLKKDLQWNDYEALCHFTNQQFYFLADKLQQKGLSEKEIRLCILSLINCSYDTMAEMLFYAPNGVGKFKLRVAKKLGTTAKKMREFLIDMAILG
ncbi:MAG: hypothetical protein IJR42_01930 [Paludibacteraceae bacterium]|nr:hypothetical protein [Paludibacteraceae bacterium]